MFFYLLFLRSERIAATAAPIISVHGSIAAASPVSTADVPAFIPIFPHVPCALTRMSPNFDMTAFGEGFSIQREISSPPSSIVLAPTIVKIAE